MKKSLILMLSLAFFASVSQAQQLPNSTFEDWSGEKFDGKEQPKSWNFSNVTQVGLSFNFAHKEAGHNGGYCVMAQDQEIGAMGITEVSPSYISLGTPWVYLPSITQINKATAGTYGGINWTSRPDTMSVWIKRTGANVLREDFHLLFYAWKGEARGNSYKGKNGDCTSVSWTNEESDIRLNTDGNECGTAQKATQICEGWHYERKEYAQWTNIRVPIYYMNDEVPTMANVIFSASNYPNFRANSGLYAGNSLYIDDVEMIYSARIDQLYIGDKPWNGFNPDTEEEQTYSIGNATTVPTIYAKRGIGSQTNSKGKTTNFIGRRLTESECKISYGKVGEVTTIKVTSADGKKTRTYKIRFARELSKNADLAEVKVNGEAIVNFSGSKLNYDVALPYGTKTAPVITCQTADEVTSCTITQASSATGTAKIVVVAANSAYSKTYTFKFSIAPLADNELKGIEVNGEPIPDFLPSITSYKISLPLDTKTCPTVKAISAYPEGAQTIKHTQPASGWIEAMKGQYILAVTTPGNPIAKKYTLNFNIKASDNCQLADLQVIVGGHNELLYHPKNKQYYITLPMGTKELPEIKYTPGDAYQTIKIEKNGVNGVTKILVTAANGDQSIYKIGFETETSTESRLKSIALDGVPLAGFNPDVKVYEYQLPIGTETLPQITCEGMDEYVETNIQTGGVNGTTRITGTAGDGSYTLYQIVFSVQQATIATLEGIYVNEQPLDGFAADVFEYTLKLPSSTTQQPVFTWKAHDKWQDISLRKPLDIAGDYKIMVKPQSGASKMYVIHVEIVLSSNTSLKNITLEGCDDFVFDPSIHEYTYTVQSGGVPKVSFEKAEECQKVVSVTTDNKVSLRVVTEDGSVSTYTITFEVPKSENAFLKMIYVDGDSLKDFSPEDLTYSYELKGTTCPAIAVDKADDKQQVTITTPQKEGDVHIIVQPETGISNTYTIRMVSPITEDVRLKQILVNGNEITDWSTSTYEYSISYRDAMPTIVAVGNEGQRIDTIRTANQISFIVSKNNSKCTYVIHLQQILSDASLLKAIKADGVLLEGWRADKLDYAFTLEAGTTIPTLTFEKQEETQQVIFGQESLNTFLFRVMAQNGATNTYTIAYHVTPYTNTELVGIQLDGEEVLSSFVNDTLSRQIHEGENLPELTYTKAVGQSAIAFNTSATQQQIIVRAENGDTRIYTIDYEVQTDVNALLSDIKIYIDGNWTSLPGFRKDSNEYTYELAWIDIRQRATNAPCVWAISDRPNQAISITYAPLNQQTIIHVEAQDGQQEDYTILFSVRKSSNTKLGTLTINNEDQDVEQTDFDWNLAVGEDLPLVEYQPAEDVQHIEYLSVNRYGTSKIIVTAENGDKRTYSIHYTIPEPEGENIIRSIVYSYTSAAGETKEDSIVKPTLGDNIVDLPFGAKEFVILDVRKNYEEQAVMLLNAGIRRGATIIVASNQKNVDDAEYHVTVRMPEFLTDGKLKELKFKGNMIPNFRPDVYNYIIGVEKQPTRFDFGYTAYNGREVTRSILDTKKKQVTFQVADGETYSVCWYYTNGNDFMNFAEEWVANANNTGYKPNSSWIVPGDKAKEHTWKIPGIVSLTYTTGKEVTPAGSNGVLLSTLRGAPLNGSVPGMMTLGGMNLELNSGGNSTSSVSKGKDYGVAFLNTPDQLVFRVKPLSTTNISAWNCWLTISDTLAYQETTYQGNFENLNQWQDVAMNINWSGLEAKVNKFNCMLSSCDQEDAKDLGGNTIYESSVMFDDIHFVYNSAITSATVDGLATEFSDNRFTLNVTADYLQTPSLHFTGAVHDQMQTIEWLNNGEWLNGDLTAKVTNYGENMKDNTTYYVVLHRDAQTSLDMTVNIPASAKAQIKAVEGKQYENVIILPNGTKHLPDMTVIPNNIHQQIAVRKSGQVVTIVVTNENADTRTYKYTFVEATSDNTNLQQIAGVEGFVAGTREYRVAEMPKVLEFVKASEGQTVNAKHFGDSAIIEVVAEDGVHQGYYRIYKNESAMTTSAQLDELKVANKDIQGFRDNIYRYTMASADLVSFVRKDAADHVLETISADSIMIRLTGTDTNAYVIEFPKEASQNAYLRDIRLNDATIDNFDPTSELPYTVHTDGAVDVQFVAEEKEQVISITTEVQPDGYDIVAKVIAADKTTEFSYRVCVRSAKSSDATLRMIYVDGVEVPHFMPEQTTYQVVLPTVSPKQSEPEMPSITYEVGQVGQRVAIEAATKLGETNYLTITAEDGTENTYEIGISAEPSHCSELTNIFVNREPIADFKASRTWYSCRVPSDEVEVAYSTDDRFQKIEIKPLKEDAPENLSKVIVVTAQDGTTREYELDIFRETSSNNANLANILLDGTDFTTYARLHNITISPFAAKRYEYDIDYVINRPLPDIDVQLQEDGQRITTNYANDTYTIAVTAPDGESKNEYRLHFRFDKSANVALKMIYLNGEALQDFSPLVTEYAVVLPIGTKSLPNVLAEPAEGCQQVAEPLTEDMKTTIEVTAENGSKQNYVISFSFTLSSADQLTAILADGKSIEGFASDSFYYYYLMPVGEHSFPSLIEGEPMDKYQTITSQTMVQGLQSTTQITVQAENGSRNVYTVVHEMQRSQVDTLQMIYLNGVTPLADFDANRTDYQVILPEGTTTVPTLDFSKGDEWQTVVVDTATSVNGISKIIVYAECGISRTYIIDFSVAPSTNALLSAILVDGEAITSFDDEIFDYTVVLPYGTTKMPAISAQKADNQQNISLAYVGWDAVLTVQAADTNVVNTYTVHCVVARSGNSKLADLLVEGYELAFDADVNDYEILVPNGTTGLPAVTPIPGDEQQTATVAVDSVLQYAEINVVSGDESSTNTYHVRFVVEKCHINHLLDIKAKGILLDGFHQDTLEYAFVYPCDAPMDTLITDKDITYTLADSTETVEVSYADAVITVLVTAEDGSIRVYKISQTFLLSANSALSNILIDDVPVKGFAPTTYFYSYLLSSGEVVPAVTAIAQDTTAEVDVILSEVGDTTFIYCTAADGTISTYAILFEYAPYNDGVTAKANDVFFKHIVGTHQYVAATIRKNVQVAVYDQSGQLLFYSDVPTADPNTVRVAVGLDGMEQLMDVMDASQGALIDVKPGEPYVYVFYESGKRAIASGKFMLSR
ncbi:MAG: hypothetical protein MJZ92_01955 [Paludibacteraceae bacterium]|nr:hypothetical protein [Paludibacteraceae bacterium]